jgi:cell division protease FtsH
MNWKKLIALLVFVVALLTLGPLISQSTGPDTVSGNKPQEIVSNGEPGASSSSSGQPHVLKGRVLAPNGGITRAPFDALLADVKEYPQAINRVTFVKDEMGNVSYVEAEYQPQLKFRVDIAGTPAVTMLLTAAVDNGVPNDTKTVASERGMGETLAGWLPMILIFFFIWWMMRSQINAANAQRRQVTQISEQEKSLKKVTFADVAGAEEAKAELMELVRYLQEPDGRHKRLGGKPPSGVLLIGDPGNGKTLLAKAVAGEADAEFHEISGSQFVELYVGVGASRVRDLFSKARENRPAVVFIDELDAVGRQRGTGLGGGHDEREQTLNQLLVEMDGFKDNEGIIFMAATNRPDVLDPALTRPGRFGLHILVDAPDKEGRISILKVHARGKKLAPDLDLSVIAANTPGFSGAQLAEVMNEATRVADRRIGKEIEVLVKDKGLKPTDAEKLVPEHITIEDLDEASDRVQMGPAKEGRGRRMSRMEMLNTAVHELGHGWISQDFYERDLGGDPVTKITIVPRARALGYTMALPSGDRYGYTEQNLRARIMMAMGGRAAQEVYLHTIDTGASNDFKQAWNIAHRMVTEFGMSAKLGPISIGEGGGNPFLGRTMASNHQLSPDLASEIDREVQCIVTECLNQAKDILTRDRECFMAIVDVLLQKETILGPEFRELRNNSVCAVPLPKAFQDDTALKVLAHIEESVEHKDGGASDVEAPKAAK